jgi:hypothetical protein
MKSSTETALGLAMFVLMLTGALANAQSGDKKSTNPPAPSSATDSAANQRTKSTGSMLNAKSNPLYEKKMEGTNPLYEGRNVDDNDPSRHHPSQGKATNVQPSANNARHDTVEYKHAEDMHTRYRAGNNKTTRLQLEGNKREPAAAPYKDPEDMTTRSKAPDNKTSKPH